MLYVLEDVGYLNASEIHPIREKAEVTKNLTLGFISYLNKSTAKV
jgi:hypothetical protein